MAAKKTSGATVTRLADRLTAAKQHELEQLELTLTERRAALGEADERIAQINTELVIATAESRKRLADLQSEIDDANAQREVMLASKLVTMHATKVYEWLLAAPPSARCCTVMIEAEGALDLHFHDEDGEPIPGPEQPQPPSDESTVGDDPEHPLVVEMELTE